MVYVHLDVLGLHPEIKRAKVLLVDTANFCLRGKCSPNSKDNKFADLVHILGETRVSPALKARIQKHGAWMREGITDLISQGSIFLSPGQRNEIINCFNSIYEKTRSDLRNNSYLLEEDLQTLAVSLKIPEYAPSNNFDEYMHVVSTSLLKLDGEVEAPWVKSVYNKRPSAADRTFIASTFDAAIIHGNVTAVTADISVGYSIINGPRFINGGLQIPKNIFYARDFSQRPKMYQN